jgi:hypothetical protein
MKKVQENVERNKEVQEVHSTKIQHSLRRNIEKQTNKKTTKNK